MRKLSEIIEAAMPSYIERGEQLTKVELKHGLGEDATPGMCVDVNKIADGHEYAIFKEWLNPKLKGWAFLAYTLYSQKKASNRAARLKWWQNQLRILKAKGL